MKSLISSFPIPVVLITLLVFPCIDCPAKDPKPLSESQLERNYKRNKRAAEKAWETDEKKFKDEEFRQMEADYQVINDKYRDPEIKTIIKNFLEKYEEGNRVGCALMYLAQKTGGPDREKLLLKAIEEHSDAYYLNGCSVGAMARLYLASLYTREGKKDEAGKWIAEIEEDYEDAQDHSRKPIIEAAWALKKES